MLSNHYPPLLLVGTFVQVNSRLMRSIWYWTKRNRDALFERSVAPLQSEAGCKRAHLLLAHLNLHWQAANKEDLCVVANALLRSRTAT